MKTSKIDLETFSIYVSSGVLIAIGIILAFPFIEKMINSDIILGFILIFLGTFLITIFHTLNNKLGNIEEYIERGMKYIKAYNVISTIDNKAIREYCRDKLHELETTYDFIVRGEIYLEPYVMFDVSVKALEDASQELRATSYITPEEFWGESGGKLYLKKQIELLKKGRIKKIRRVFILRDEKALKEEFLKQIIKTQKENGIEVKYVVNPPDDLRIDMLIIDNDVTQTLELGVDGNVVRVKVIFEKTLVKRYIQKFEQLWSLAKDIPEIK